MVSILLLLSNFVLGNPEKFLGNFTCEECEKLASPNGFTSCWSYKFAFGKSPTQNNLVVDVQIDGFQTHEQFKASAAIEKKVETTDFLHSFQSGGAESVFL